jgi:hypothetical protein
MIRQFCRVACVLAFVSLALAAVAPAAGPRKGATYRGAMVQDKAPISLKVSRNGRFVTVSARFAPLFCFGVAVTERQITKPARIGRKGSFKAVIAYEFTLTHKRTSKLYVNGRFVTRRRVRGTARSEFPRFHLPTNPSVTRPSPCNGTTTFSARAR